MKIGILMSMKSIVEQEKRWLLDEKYNGVVTDEYKDECALLEDGMPVAYLIGNIEFLGCHIDLEYKPLIPRAETEYWTDLFIKQVKKKYSEVELRNLEILDIFSGSGCIGIACAKHLQSHVTIGELQEQNIAQIKKNISNNNLENISSYQSDVFSEISQKKYSYILANPPYIDRNKDKQVQHSVTQNEDYTALFTDNQGLSFVYQLIDQAPEYLKINGELWIEFDSWQTDLIDTYLADKPTWSHTYLADQYNKPRVLILKLTK